MHKYLLVILFITLLSCSEDSTILNAEEEIQNYLKENKLQAQRTDSGLYYIIEDTGIGDKVQPADRVRLSYKGQYIDGTIFEETHNEGINLCLEFSIKGLSEGLSFFRESSKGKLIIPPSLTTPASASGIQSKEFPKDRILIFDFDLIFVNYKTENEKEIQEYLSENNLNAQKTESGLYYVITEEGTGSQPTSSSNITVDYEMYYTDGEIIDERTNTSFNIQELIVGWQEGLTFFKEGGKGKLIIPSHLAYGNKGIFGISPGAVLVSDINLILVN